MDDKEVILSLFVDFKKAFDLINPDLLFHKLVHYGFDNKALNFIMAYFKNRKQVTLVESESSESCELSIGVPQGSVLGPLLFLVYINDLSSSSELASFLFANDTTLFEYCDDISVVISRFIRKLEPFFDWVKFKQLTINWSKTKFMFLTNKRVDIQKVFREGYDEIVVVKSLKLLGCMIDNKLLFGGH